MNNIETALTINVEVDPEDDADDVREVLEEIVDGLDVDGYELVHPGFWACVDCGALLTTNSAVKVVGGEPIFERASPDDVEDEVVPLSRKCNGCGANAWRSLEFGVLIDVR